MEAGESPPRAWASLRMRGRASRISPSLRSLWLARFTGSKLEELAPLFGFSADRIRSLAEGIPKGDERVPPKEIHLKNEGFLVPSNICREYLQSKPTCFRCVLSGFSGLSFCPACFRVAPSLK